ncbi:MAG: squalene-hopene cyclase [Bacillales bacterium]|jgi:sporulenol synthase|nr:squalene-hopene cyclase [Bacillales bacterium]
MLETKKGIEMLIEKLRRDQSPDGSWNYPFETGISTDAYMVILLRTLEINDEEFIYDLTRRILSKQEKNGAWKMFYDEGNGNVSITIEAYYALLYSGYYSKDDTQLLKAKIFIQENGGIDAVSILTKIMLALTGQYKWPPFSPLPIEAILLPKSFPINFYSFSVFGRANLAPTMILAEQKFSIKTEKSPNLSDLYVHRQHDDQWIRSSELRSLLSFIENGVKNLIGIPEQLHQLAIDRAKNYMIAHLEPDGSLYSYFGATYLMIFAFLALGYKKTDPIIRNAIDGIRAMKSTIKGFPHMQYTTANVWNTALIGYTLQSAGVSDVDPMVTNANGYLLSRQHTKLGDWAIHNPNIPPGGWGFSNVNTMNPDVDDTTAALRSISSMYPIVNNEWAFGNKWLLSMQNNDGGWPAFEKNINSKLSEFLPIEKGEYLLTDPSCADITGRVLEFYGNYTVQSVNHPSIEKGISWLLKNQEKDGSWYGRWGICYIYGTWAAITGLHATHIPKNHPAIQKAVNWLLQIQNGDGGWGESCKSDSKKAYIPLQVSTLTHTAWALDALIAASEEPTTAINKGINYLLNSLDKDDWTTDYPKGQGIPGTYYIHYHSYRYIFPLLALSHYQRKFENNE